MSLVKNKNEMFKFLNIISKLAGKNMLHGPGLVLADAAAATDAVAAAATAAAAAATAAAKTGAV